MFLRRHLLGVVAVLYFAFIIWLTFTHRPAPPAGEVATPSDWIVSLVLFVPVGLLLTLMMGRRRWWVAVGFGVLGAAWVEAAQRVWMPEGYASVDDILASSAGAVIGVGIGVVALTMALKAAHSHGSPRLVAQGGRREIPQD